MTLRLATLLVAASALPCPPARAARLLESVDYFCPVTFQFTVTRELPASPTAKGTANTVSISRYGNREILEAVADEYGGKRSDWSLVAYAGSDNCDDITDLAIVARRKDGQLAPVQALDFTALNYLSAQSDAYTIVHTLDAELLSSSFEKKYLATCEQEIAGGTFVGTGILEHKITFGMVRVAGVGARLFKPGGSKLVMTGVHSSADNAVAELTIKLSAPRLVPFITNTGGGTVIIITPVDPTQVSAE